MLFRALSSYTCSSSGGIKHDKKTFIYNWWLQLKIAANAPMPADYLLISRLRSRVSVSPSACQSHWAAWYFLGGGSLWTASFRFRLLSATPWTGGWSRSWHSSMWSRTACGCWREAVGGFPYGWDWRCPCIFPWAWNATRLAVPDSFLSQINNCYK